MAKTYPDQEWEEEKFKKGFYGIDVNKEGSIDFTEMFKVIYDNAFRQGMVVGSAAQQK